MRQYKTLRFTMLLSFLMGLSSCATEESVTSNLASQVETCPDSLAYGLAADTVDARDIEDERSYPSGLQANPGFDIPEGRSMRGDYLPTARNSAGEIYVDFPRGSDANGNPIIAPETAVTDQENYPYETYQGRQGNCVPRAFEVKTGIYNPYLDETMTGSEKRVKVGGHTFVGRGEGVKPQKGDVVFYSLPQGKHAGIVTGYDEEQGVIIASGHQGRPYDYRQPEEIIQSYYEPAE